MDHSSLNSTLIALIAAGQIVAVAWINRGRLVSGVQALTPGSADRPPVADQDGAVAGPQSPVELPGSTPVCPQG